VVVNSVTKNKIFKEKKPDLLSVMEAVNAEVKQYPKVLFLDKKIHSLKDKQGYYIL